MNDEFGEHLDYWWWWWIDDDDNDKTVEIENLERI